MDHDQTQPTDGNPTVKTVRVVDNIELMPSGDELYIASKELVFEDGRFVKADRLDPRAIKIEGFKFVTA